MSDENNLRNAYIDYSPAMLRVTVKNEPGDLENGAAFHIGNGVVVTARHVLEGNTLVEMVSEGSRSAVNVRAIHYHDDPNVDLAVAETDLDLSHYMTMVSFPTDERRNKAKTDRIPLGGHLDDWIGNEFVLSKVLVMGYPRIPFWAEIGLVAATGEVNAVIDRYDVPHPHFVLSSIARGGFSGGPAFSEWGFLLGVVTQSLVEGGKQTEQGFSVCVSIEPLLTLLAKKGLRPPDFEDELWDLVTPKNDSEKEQQSGDED